MSFWEDTNAIILPFENGFSVMSRMVQRDLHLMKDLSIVVLRFSLAIISISVTFIYGIKESLSLSPLSPSVIHNIFGT